MMEVLVSCRSSFSYLFLLKLKKTGKWARESIFCVGPVKISFFSI